MACKWSCQDWHALRCIASCFQVFDSGAAFLRYEAWYDLLKNPRASVPVTGNIRPSLPRLSFLSPRVILSQFGLLKSSPRAWYCDLQIFGDGLVEFSALERFHKTLSNRKQIADHKDSTVLRPLRETLERRRLHNMIGAGIQVVKLSETSNR